MIIRDYYIYIFHIGLSISPRLTYHARQRSWSADMGRGLISGTIWKISCHNLFITYFTFFKHWLLYCKNKKKIFELTNSKNKSLRVPLFNFRKYFCFESGFKKISNNVDLYVRKEILIQHDVYIWATYSVLSYLNFIPIFSNVLNWLKYDCMHNFMHQLSLYFDI